MTSRTFILYTFLLGVFASCRREEVFEGGEPMPPQLIDTDSLIESSLYALSGQQWVLTAYRIESFATPIATNDTLQFATTTTMEYNHTTGTYSLYPSASVWMLNLNNTPWGMVSGAIHSYNLSSGRIEGLPFSMVSAGAMTQRIYIWMERID